MKFVCDGVVLSDAAIIVSKACATRTVIPVYECIRITAKNDGITMVAHDGEITIEKGQRFKTMILNAGMIIYCIFWLVTIVVQLFA